MADVKNVRADVFASRIVRPLPALALMLATAAPAFANEATDVPAASATSGMADDDRTIIVTAQRRSESIQSVPLSVTALSGETLQKLGVRNFNDYAVLVPNLSFGTGNGFGISTSRQITIRGISGTNTTSYYIDDTPLPQSLDPRVLDLQRVEVLRGPQGTLFGASSLGGTVRLITRQPDAGGNNGFLDLQGFGVNKGGAGYEAAGSYNFTVIPGQLAVKLTAFSSYEPGIFTRRWGAGLTPGYTVPAGTVPGREHHVGDDREYGGMLSATWTPDALPGLTVTPMLIYQNTRMNGFPLADYDPHNLVQQRPLDVPEYSRDKWFFSALTVKYDTGFGDLISSTSYFDRRTNDLEDGTETVTILYGAYYPPNGIGTVYQESPGPFRNNNKVFTEEARFQSRFNGPFQFTAGAYYNNNRNRVISDPVGPYTADGDSTFYEDSPRQGKEIAGFVSTNLTPFEGFELSAGVRRSHLSYLYTYIAGGWLNGGISNSRSFHKENATTPRFTARYQITRDHNVYANVAKGYRVGGTTSALAPVCTPDLVARGLPVGTDVPYTSDKLWSYEVGTKDSWAGGKVRTRLAAYQIDWSDIQQTVRLDCGMRLALNAGSARSRGGEFEMDIQPAPGLSFNLGLGYEDAKITRSVPGAQANFSVGQPLSGVPKWTGSLQGDYSIPTSFGSAFVRGSYSYVGRSVSFNNNPSGLSRHSYNMIDLRTGAIKDDWMVTLFVKNLTDVRANYGDYQPWDGQLADRPRYMIARPRTIGIELRRNFR